MINTTVNYVDFYYPFYKHLTYPENLIKSSLIYRYLYEKYLKEFIEIEKIIY